MEKKNSKKKSGKWECPSGCKPGKKPCGHLEKLLPNEELRYMKYDTLTRMAEVYRSIEAPEEARYAAYEDSLRTFGFKDYEIDLIMDRFISNLSIREITDNISIRNGQYGDYIYYKTSKMKKPTFYKLNGFKEDYKTCHTTIVKNWIMDVYQIRP